MLGERPDVLLSEVEGDIGKVSGSADLRTIWYRPLFYNPATVHHL